MLLRDVCRDHEPQVAEEPADQNVFLIKEILAWISLDAAGDEVRAIATVVRIS